MAPNTHPPVRTWISTAEAARRTGLSGRAIATLCDRRPGVGFRPHPTAHWRVDADAVVRLLAEQHIANTAA